MQKNYLIAQESSRYSVRRQDSFFCFFLYKNVSQKIGFCIWIKIKICHHKKTTRTLIYTKKNGNVFYIQKSWHFSKSYTISVTLFSKKNIQLTLRGFHEIFEVGIYIQKAWHFALRHVFIHKNLDASQKVRKFAIHFYTWDPTLLRYAIFHWIFWNLRTGGNIYVLKKCTQLDIFI